jgi:hypothetical protein
MAETAASSNALARSVIASEELFSIHQGTIPFRAKESARPATMPRLTLTGLAEKTMRSRCQCCTPREMRMPNSLVRSAPV